MPKLLVWLCLIFLTALVLGFLTQIQFLYSHETKSAQVASSNTNIIFKVKPNISDSMPVSSSNQITSAYLKESSIPEIVRAWRAAKLDWHELLPHHNSAWERFGTPQKEGKLRLLISKEVQLTNFLTRFHESGLSSKYGHAFGPMLPYSGCDKFDSPCMVHDRNTCAQDQLCQWSSERDVCWDRSADPTQPSSVRTCANPQMIAAEGGFKHVSPSECNIWVDQPAIVAMIDSESQSMFYHWWATWNGIHTFWEQELKKNRNIHIFLSEINDPMFFHFFGLISDICWKRPLLTNIRPGVCFCDVTQRAFGQFGHTVTAVPHIVSYLGLSEIKPPKDRAKVGLISRRRKRFILNEYELIDEIERMGYEAELLPLESMTLYEQIRALRSLDVMVGIHGSALDNSVFLHPDSVMVQLLGYKLDHVITFPETAHEARVQYMDWKLTDRTKTVLHWDLFKDANTEKFNSMSKEAIIAGGSAAAEYREIGMFWINQDIIVPLDEWRETIRKAVAMSPAKNRGVPL